MTSSISAKQSFFFLPARREYSIPSLLGLSTVVLAIATAAYAFAGGWSAPVSLSTPVPPTFYTTSPTVAINSAGAQAAAWIIENNNLLLQVAAQDSGGGWSKAQTLTPLTGFEAADPSIAIGPTGIAVAMWDRYQNSPPNGLVIQASSRPAHGSWGPVVSLSPAAGSSSLPKVGVDASGNAIAIWQQTNSASTAIETADLPAGGSWSMPVAISTPGVSAQRPTLAVNASGDAIAGWQSANGQILVAERKFGVWGSPVVLAPAAFRQGGLHVALNDRGDGAAVWSGRGTTRVATRAEGGSWSAPTTVSTQSEGGTASIALDDSGNAVAAFAIVQYSGGGYVYPVQAVSRPAGGLWSAPASISGASEYATATTLVATPAGTFVAGWTDDNTLAVRAAIRPQGQTAFGPPVSISSGSQIELAVAAGRTAATWIGPGPAVQVSDNSTP
jgi:hypothetical protein